MGCFVRCKSCNANLYLQQQKNELNFPVQINCNQCFRPNTYYVYEIQQERHDYRCNFCSKSFFIRKPTPRTVSCPHCNSRLYLDVTGSITILSNGKLPSRDADTAGGIAGGALVGALFGPAGAILGAILGGALAREGVSREAKDE